MYLLMCLSSIESVTAAIACSRAKLRKLKVTVPAPPKVHTTYACARQGLSIAVLILRIHAADAAIIAAIQRDARSLSLGERVVRMTLRMTRLYRQ